MSHRKDQGDAPLELDQELATRIAERMRVLATASRVRILAELKSGPATVGELAEATGMEQSAVSHQLRTLRYLRFVVGRRNGRQVVYELHDDHVAELLDQVIFHVQHLDEEPEA